MANTANVDALTELITQRQAQVTRDETAPRVDPVVAGRIADWLVSCPTPVLVISDAVLTDEVARELAPDLGAEVTNSSTQANVIAVLSHIAKGG